ncbi:MAG: FAD-binding protein, partial [Planctomycetota bacterium]
VLEIRGFQKVFSESLNSYVQEDVALAERCWLRIGGSARFFAEVPSSSILTQLCKEATAASLPVRVLGAGSNLLIRSGQIDALVVRLTGEFETVTISDNKIVVGAAASLGDLISAAAEAGLAGLEHLAGIPGTVGAAVVCNSGVKNDDLGSRVQRVCGVDRDGQEVELSREELKFGYRRSNLEHLIVTSAEIELQKQDPAEVTRKLQANWIVKKAAQPAVDDCLAQAFIEPSGWQISELLEAAGMKSASEGEASMNPEFPGYLGVTKEADAKDVLALMGRIARAVEVQSGIQLHQQLKIW